MSSITLPKGSIAIWSSDIQSTPSGWSICNGENNTPNLAGLFIRGCDNDKNFLQPSGSKTHAHGINIKSNADGIYFRNAYDDNYFQAIDGNSEIKFHFSGNTDESTAYPPYRALYNVLCTSTTSQIPTGIITIWSGPAGTQPSGWAMCDGSNGTPKLTDYFVIQPDGQEILPFSVNDSTTHIHHVNVGGKMEYSTRGTNGKSWELFNSDHAPQAQINVDSDEESSIPPYYALSYIMKL